MPNESLGDLLGQLTTKTTTLVRDEIELAKQEMRESFNAIASGAVMITAGAVFAFCALIILCLAVVFALASNMSPGLAALLTGAALAVIAGLIAFIGLSQIKKANLKPQKTIQTLKEGKQWLKERV